MNKQKNIFLANNYIYKLTIRDFNQNLILQKILILQKLFLIEFNSSLKIILKNSLIKHNKKFTLLKAPFVHKKAREQFNLSTVSQTIFFYCKFKIKKFFNFFIFNSLKSKLKLYNINYISFSCLIEKK